MTLRRHRRHSTVKKREIVEAYPNGEALHALSKQHDACRNPIRIWVEKYERGEYDDDAIEADLVLEHEDSRSSVSTLTDRSDCRLAARRS